MLVCIVLYHIVWSRVALCGLVWSRVVSCGLVWLCVVSCGIVWLCSTNDSNSFETTTAGSNAKTNVRLQRFDGKAQQAYEGVVMYQRENEFGGGCCVV